MRATFAALAAILLVAGALAVPAMAAEDGSSQPPADRDHDSIPDDTDNCPEVANDGQQDTDGDGTGDACDRAPHDPKEDGVKDGDKASPPPPATCNQPADNPCHDARFNDCMRKAREDDGQVQPDEAKDCTAEYCAKNPGTKFCDRWCSEHPDRAFCKDRVEGDQPSGKEACLRAAGDDGSRREACREYCGEHPQECKAFCSSHPGAPGCNLKPRGDERHITFQPAPDGFANLTVNGRLILVSVRMDSSEAIESERDDHRLVVEAGKNRLEIHDDASGFVRFQGPDATVTLVFPEGITHNERSADGIGPKGKVMYRDGTLAFLDADALEWTDARTAVASGFLSFHLVPGQGERQGPPSDVQVKLREKGDKVGAEVRFGRGQDAQVLAFDRLNITFKQPKDRPSESDPLRVVLDSDLGSSGRTVVLHINRTMVDTDENGVFLRYFDLPEGPEAIHVRTEVVFLRASSIDDVLDPDNDNGQPEYWVVRDANGLQVLVSVPHWSAHMVELAALAQVVPPSVLVGIVVGLAGTVVAAVAVFMPRRRA